MNRLTQLFRNKATDVLAIYYTAGYPELEDTVSIACKLDELGVDIIELGIPYSDPLADGPTIQLSSAKALENGMNLEKLFEQIVDIRQTSSIPIVLMGYYNQVLQYGTELFCRRCKEVGVDGLIFPDIPIEEFEKSIKPILDKYELCFSFLITPKTGNERILLLDKLSSGFLYAVANHSITGGKIDHSANPYGNKLESLSLRNPVMVGFGISNQEDLLQANQVGAGCIIGSAFIKAITQGTDLEESIQQFIYTLKPVIV